MGKATGKGKTGRTAAAKPKADSVAKAKAKAAAEARLRKNWFSVVFQGLIFHLESRGSAFRPTFPVPAGPLPAG